jgi:hypothetical protein
VKANEPYPTTRVQTAGHQILLTTAGDTLSTHAPAPAHRHRGDEKKPRGKAKRYTCVAEQGALIGPVCVEIRDIDILTLHDILTT